MSFPCLLLAHQLFSLIPIGENGQRDASQQQHYSMKDVSSRPPDTQQNIEGRRYADIRTYAAVACGLLLLLLMMMDPASVKMLPARLPAVRSLQQHQQLSL